MADNISKRVVIIGAGFAGMYSALHLEKIFAGYKDVSITLINRNNFFLFTPMLAEVVSSSIEAKHVIIPVRELLKRVTFQEADVRSIDFEKKMVTASHCSECGAYHIEYDYLVIAPGSVTNFYGLPGVEENSFPLKTLSDAMILRNHIIDMFEHADLEPNPKVRQELLTFIVAGGGFAGVEVAAELNDFISSTRRFYRNIRSNEIRMILAVSGSRIMPEINEDLALYAQDKLHKYGIELQLKTRVNRASPDGVELNNGEQISTGTLIWTAGTIPDPIIDDLSCERDKKGRIIVNEYLELPDRPEVFAIGDCAQITDPETGNSFPPTAQHAVGQGKQAAQNIAAAILNSGDEKRSFSFSSLGTLAPLGHRTAVAQIKGHKLSGFFAWWLWRTIYLSKMPGIDRKIRVALDWTLDLFLPRDIVQLKIFMKNKK